MLKVDYNQTPPAISREPVPHYLAGLPSESLRDLSWVPEPYTEEVRGICYLPPVDVEVAYNPETHALTSDGESVVADLVAGVVYVTPAVRELTAEELQDRAETLKALKWRLVQSIDDLIASIYSRWMRFEAEYVEREAAARAFVQVGCVGDPGVWVTSFAVSAGKSNQEAADLIIAQADGLRLALQQLGALRMSKYAIVAAGDAGAAQAKHDEVIAQANAIAASLA